MIGRFAFIAGDCWCTSPKIVAERLGHASVNLTLNVYSHTIRSMQHEAAQDLEKALCG